MKDNYIITVVGKQTVDDESDKIEVITEGELREENGKITITYPEYPEDDGEYVFYGWSTERDGEPAGYDIHGTEHGHDHEIPGLGKLIE